MSKEEEAIELAKLFHGTYERLAPAFGYKTRKESRKKWYDVPEKNRKLMIAVAEHILAELEKQPEPCKTCGGSGAVPIDENGIITTMTKPCLKCKGTGTKPTCKPEPPELAKELKAEAKRFVKSGNWRGGKHISSHGYVKVLVGTKHHLADGSGYAYEHRVVAENKLGRLLKPNEKIHHIDGNRENNAPENIKIVIGNAEHFRKPNEPNLPVVCACGCGYIFPKYDKSGRPRKYISGHNMKEW